MALTAENWTPEYFISNESQCLLHLEDDAFLTSIVNLDGVPLDSVKHGQLVRFQGMIQDMRNPEFYYEKYVVKNLKTEQTEIRQAKYKDMIHVTAEEELVEYCENQSGERQTFIVISVPGLNDWARKKTEIEERKRFFVDIFDKSIESVNSKKRQQEDMEVDDCPQNANKKEKRDPKEEASSSSKPQNNTSQLLVSKEHMLNFPVHNTYGKSCIVKVYEKDCSIYKLNQIIDVIGFISFDPNLAVYHDSDKFSDMEVQTHHPPASLIPRLHAIKVSIPKKPTLTRDPALVSTFQSIRAELHKVLSHILFNDNLVADYLICHLISSIYKRNGYMCLGSFPLNITNFPEIKQENPSENEKISFPKTLYSLISTILPKSVYLECTLDNLNDLSFVPKKDYECDRLTSGILQLSPNTHLVIDETQLDSGRVSENGKINYNALCDIIKNQRINYDFKYYQMEYETDIPILIISHAGSFIKGAIRVPIQPEESAETYPAVLNAVSKHMNDESLVDRIRNYLHLLKYADFTIDDEVSKVMQDDLVELKNTNSEITADDFHRCLVFSRLMALSYGSDKLTIELWKQSLLLEVERMNRISKLLEKHRK